MPFKEKRKFIFYIICKRLESNELFENIFFPYIRIKKTNFNYFNKIYKLFLSWIP